MSFLFLNNASGGISCPRTVIALFMLFFVACEKQEDPATIKKSIDEMDTRFAESVMRKDVDGIASLYWKSPDLMVYYPDTMVLRGYDAVRTYWQEVFAVNDVRNFGFMDHHVDATPSMAVAWGEWTFTVQPKGAPSDTTLYGRYVQAWEFKDGKWVIVVDHAYSPFSPPPPPAPRGDEQSIRKGK